MPEIMTNRRQRKAIAWKAAAPSAPTQRRRVVVGRVADRRRTASKVEELNWRRRRVVEINVTESMV